MSEFLAIVSDTWKQSKQQVVFILLMVILLGLSIIAIAVPKVHVDDAGEKQFGIIFMDAPISGLKDMWLEMYAMSMTLQTGEKINPMSQEAMEKNQALNENREKAVELTEEISDFQKSVEMYVYIVAAVILTFSMWGFIGATAPYFPNLLEAGAVDVVLSKPLSRFKIFFGKYIGGLVLFTLLITAIYGLIMFGVGVRTGVWHIGIFKVLPLHLYLAAVLFAMITLFGVLWRSTALAVIIGYVYYIVVDTVLGVVVQLQMSGITEKIAWLDTVFAGFHYLPNFGFMKEVAAQSALQVPYIDTKPLIVAGVWMLATLGFAFWRFRSTDY